MSDLSQREIEDAAREAGISPDQLRHELARQSDSRGLPSESLLPAPTRGVSVTHSESPLPFPADQAIRAVKHAIEAQVGARGHMLGSTEADVLDEGAGVVYRVQARDDGGGGSVVRIDIDPTPMRVRRGLFGMGLGAMVGLFMLSGMIIPGLLGAGLVGAAIGIGVVGGVGLAARGARTNRSARFVASSALVEAEHGGSKALPPGDH